MKAVAKVRSSLVLVMMVFSFWSAARDTYLDSLFNIWDDPGQPDTTRLMAMDLISWNGYLYSQPDSAFYYAQQAYDLAEAGGLKKHMSLFLNTMGVSYRLRGEYYKALEYYQRCLEIREELGDRKGVAGSLNNMGLIYSNIDQYAKSLDYYNRSLKIYEEIGSKVGIANALNNIGIIYVSGKDPLKALEYFQRSLKIDEETGDKKAIAGGLTNVGNIYLDLGEFQKALEHHMKGLEMYRELGDRKGIADCLLNMGHSYKYTGELENSLNYYRQSKDEYAAIGDKNGVASSLAAIGGIYVKNGAYNTAIEGCSRGYQMAVEIGTVSTQRDACKCLYEAYKAVGNGSKALAYFEKMQMLDDSLKTEETSRQLERMEFQKQMLADSLYQEEEKLRMQVEHQRKLTRESRKRNLAMATGIIFIIIAGSLYNRVRYMRKSRAAIARERDRSENLLLNILPNEIAQELKEKGRTTAHDFERVSILFTDFREFTQTSQQMSAQQLVQELHTCFEAFDRICENNQVEKIKTIGDAYMAAGGLPVPSEESVGNTVLAGLEMAAFMKERGRAQAAEGKICFEMRVGIHTGPVVAGIVGVKKFQYDVWGDTVNTASRMESYGDVGKVNISQQTYDLIREDSRFRFEARGKVQVKGKGEMEMYFVSLAGDPEAIK